MRRARSRKAAPRMAQGKPARAMMRSTMIGRITPPRELPAAMMPKARARRLKNQVPVLLMAG